MKPHVVVTMLLNPPTMAALDRAFTLHRLWEAKDKVAYLAEIKDRVEGLATFGGYSVDDALMAALPNLKIISTMTIGVDHIDLAAAKARGIKVTNTPDVLTDDVADLAIALLLATARRLVVADRFVRSGEWLKREFPLGTKVAGATMGILGLGRIGLAIGQRAEALRMKVVYHGPRRKSGVPYRYYEDLVAMARDVNHLMVACPGGAETRHLVNEKVLAGLGPQGTVVNIARGSVIDEAALVKALIQGKLAGAGLDVFAAEPRVPEALFALDNVVLTPHIGSGTEATRIAMGRLMVDNLKAHFGGEPLLTPVV